MNTFAPETPVVFFDLGDTLGTPRVSFDPTRLVGFDVYPYVPGVLADLRGRAIRLGVISNTGEETLETMMRVLESAGIAAFFDSRLLLFSSVTGLTKDSVDVFDEAASRAGHREHPDRCLFVGEDSAERWWAVRAGFRVAPHPLLVADVLAGQRLRYVHVEAPDVRAWPRWQPGTAFPAFVPLKVADGRRRAYGIASPAGVAALAASGLAIELLGPEGAPDTTQAYVLRDLDPAALQEGAGRLPRSLFAGDEPPHRVLRREADGLLVAIPGDRSVEEFHFATTRHGHLVKLRADVALLEPFGAEPAVSRAAWLPGLAAAAPTLTEAARSSIAGITADSIRSLLDRYTGVVAADASGATIASRHIVHPHNQVACEVLARDLAAVSGLRVALHQFTHQGRTLHNVVADLEAAPIPEELVLVTAHLDSTAAQSAGYRARTDPAPGADDDASGVVAVLAVARALAELAAVEPARRSLRFVLFNAEEHGLVGSRAYAALQASAHARIVGVLQMDMVGFNARPPYTFEIHVGADSPDVQERSRLLAERLVSVAPIVAPLLAEPQIYDKDDPAQGRSDHASFHDYGYAACAVSEDYFAGPTEQSPAPDGTPHYHQRTDTAATVDPEFIGAIARAVAAAAWSVQSLDES
jgi:hypothetical protein